jgi:hypothetical protein
MPVVEEPPPEPKRKRNKKKSTALAEFKGNPYD